MLSLSKHERPQHAMFERGIFCIEGEWEDDLSVDTSVQQLLAYVGSNLRQLGKAAEGVEYSPPIYRRAATSHELHYLIDKWNGYPRYTIGYFAFHGSQDGLLLGDRCLTLADLSALLEYQCSGKHVILSSCNTLCVEEDALRAFREKTGARSISGYSKGPDWYECSALDMMLMTDLLYYDDPPVVRNRLHKLCAGLIEEYGFILNC